VFAACPGALRRHDRAGLYLEQRLYPDEVRKRLKGYDHFATGTIYCNWNVQYWYWLRQPGHIWACTSGESGDTVCFAGTRITYPGLWNRSPGCPETEESVARYS